MLVSDCVSPPQATAIFVYSYEGRLLCSPRWPGMRPESLSRQTVSISSDCVAVRDQARASNEGYAKVRKDFTITEKAFTMAFSWLKAPTSAFTIKTLIKHYAKQTLTPR